MQRQTINVDTAKPLDIQATADTTFELDIILDETVAGTVALELCDTIGGQTVEIAGTVTDTTLSFRGHYTQMVFATGIYRYVCVNTDTVADTKRNLFAGFFIFKPRLA